MQSTTILQPPFAASSRFYKLCAQILQPSFRRHQSSYRRTRSRLNVKPDPAFLPSRTEQHDHIIFNPPPSMPNVYHTPNIFLPKNDRRKILPDPETRQAQLQMSQQAPALSGQGEKRYHLTAKDVQEIRDLRRADPTQWSIQRLAKKYDCNAVFVMLVVDGLAKQKGNQQKLVKEIVKSRWGTKRREAREDRELRKERWYKDA